MTTVELAAPLTPEWHEARRKGIGASEIAAVLGISPWESPLSLYWRKVNGWEIDDTEEMRTGRILEPAIAEWARWTIDPNDCSVAILDGRLLAHPDRPWQLATPDRVVWFPREIEWGDPDPKPVAALELKWTGSWDGWGDEGTDQIPVYYRTQVLWQCDVLGVSEWYLATLGPSGFRLYRGRRDDKDLAVMVEAGRRFMARLEAGDPPPLDDHHATVDILRRLHPDMVDESVDVPSDIAAGYLRAVRMERLAKAAKTKYEAQLRDAMGDARRATAGGRRVATRVITDIAERTQTVAAHRRDYLLAAKESKQP